MRYIGGLYMPLALPDSTAVNQAIDQVYKAFNSFEPQRKSEQLLYHQMLENFNNGLDERAQRISQAHSNAPAGIRILMIINALSLIIVMCLLGSNYRNTQRNKVALVSSIVIMSLVLSILIEYPYAGQIAVKPTVLQRLLTSI